LSCDENGKEPPKRRTGEETGAGQGRITLVWKGRWSKGGSYPAQYEPQARRWKSHEIREMGLLRLRVFLKKRKTLDIHGSCRTKLAYHLEKRKRGVEKERTIGEREEYKIAGAIQLNLAKRLHFE